MPAFAVTCEEKRTRRAQGAAPSADLARARFQTLHAKLVSLRLNQDAIRSETCDQDMLLALMHRQADTVDRLCDLVIMMGSEHDFRQIDALLARAEPAALPDWLQA
jgi:hypothetical protein